MKRTKSEAALTRAAILEAAELLFYQKGMTSCSLDEIAVQAGVTRGALYWHFQGKKDLVSALFTGSYVSILREILGENNIDIRLEPLKSAEHKILMWLDALSRLPHLKRMSAISLRMDMQAHFGAPIKVVRRFESKGQKMLKFAFHRAQDLGHLGKGHSPENCFSTTRCLVRGFEYEILFGAGDDSIFEIAKLGVASLFSSYRRNLLH